MKIDVRADNGKIEIGNDVSIGKGSRLTISHGLGATNSKVTQSLSPEIKIGNGCMIVANVDLDT